MPLAAAIAGRSAGSVTARNARHRLAPSIRAASSWRGIEVRPQAADGADDHRVVEEHVRDQDRGEGLVEAEEREWPAGAEHAGERGADDDGREHERHRHQGAHEPTAPELEARQHERARQRDQHGEDRRQRRLPHREPRDVPQRRVGDDLAERREVELAAGCEPAPDDRRHRVHEEHRQERERHERERQHGSRASRRRVSSSPQHGRAPLLDPLVTVAAIWSGGSVNGFGETSANCSKTFGSATSVAHREHEHLQRHVGLERRRQHEVDELARRGLVRRALEHPDELHLAEARVEHRADGRRLRLAASSSTPRPAGSTRTTPRAGASPCSRPG